MDLNHRPLGYEPKGSISSPVDFIAFPRTNQQNLGENGAILHASCTLKSVAPGTICTRDLIAPEAIVKALAIAKSMTFQCSRAALWGTIGAN